MAFHSTLALLVDAGGVSLLLVIAGIVAVGTLVILVLVIWGIVSVGTLVTLVDTGVLVILGAGTGIVAVGTFVTFRLSSIGGRQSGIVTEKAV